MAINFGVLITILTFIITFMTIVTILCIEIYNNSKKNQVIESKEIENLN